MYKESGLDAFKSGMRIGSLWIAWFFLAPITVGVQWVSLHVTKLFDLVDGELS